MDPSDYLHKRGRALEDEFFYRVDMELAEQLRQRLKRDARKSTLAKVCGWASDELLEHLVDADITAENLASLTLVPLVRVAWADRHVEQAEKEAILRAATTHKCPEDSVAYPLLESWLNAAPLASLFSTWQEYTQALCATLPEDACQALKREVMAQTREVAEAAGGFMGIKKISAAEEHVLAEIEAVFDSR